MEGFCFFPGVLEEARFFGIERLAEQLEVAIKVRSFNIDAENPRVFLSIGV